jgi:hypothetical protein
MQKFDNHGIMELVVLTRGLIQMRLLDFGRLIYTESAPYS